MLIGDLVWTWGSLLLVFVFSLEILLSLGRLRNRPLFLDPLPKVTKRLLLPLPANLYGLLSFFGTSKFEFHLRHYCIVIIHQSFILLRIRSFMSGRSTLSLIAILLVIKWLVTMSSCYMFALLFNLPILFHQDSSLTSFFFLVIQDGSF